MPKGGARARSGPAPDPNALRRERDGDSWVTLPSEGRKGPVPAWPLTSASPREEDLWDLEWERPQAIMWEQNGQESEVAMYVRTFVAAEEPDASMQSRTLLRQQQEALGINLPGLARNRWRIDVEGPSAIKKNARVRASRNGLRVVNGGAA